MRVEVNDNSTHDPHIRTPDLAGVRGMIVIDRLATAWGVIHYAVFKTVWAGLTLDRPHRPPMAVAPDPDRPDSPGDS
ncbi:hypothetical protein [Nocardia sp. NBC_01327]|uniref:hypothetical protein n=1 Tax=Nocardia sp. NBC_01327 TaxID=2903593 RepID=UPI002E0EA6B2|nr:hypothetical protein OG326_22330 [Nocardia sp. NBC_01327]